MFIFIINILFVVYYNKKHVLHLFDKKDLVNKANI